MSMIVIGLQIAVALGLAIFVHELGHFLVAKWFDVKERIDLSSLLSERDLESAQLVKNPEIRKKLAGIGYIVIGGVTISGN